jgi:NAD(P)-dependent dehydrogenase (short-subunit alcohol dehydrogenase family)
MRLENKIAIVTGAARGIGRATAELFAEEGAIVYAGDLSLDDPFTDPNIHYVALDVTREEDWRRVVDEVVTAHGRIDVLFNNAGLVGSYAPLDTIDLTDWRRIFDVNLNGALYGVRAVVPVMRRGGGGSMIHTSSIWAIAGAAGVAAYTASKGAVRLLSKNVALTYVGDNIRSNSLHPGIIDTPMIADQAEDVTAVVVGATPMGRLGTPREIAQGVLFLASDESSFMTGAELVIDGGYTAQ